MSAKYYVTITNYGAQLISQAHEQNTIALTYMVVGDANGIPYNPIDRKDLTELINQKAQFPIQSIEILDSVIRVTATLDAHIGGFNIHEIGLIDTSGKLLYLGNYHGAYKPIITDGGGGELEIVIDIKVNANANVLIQIDPNIVTANKNWVQQELEKIGLKFNSLTQAIYHVGSWHGTNSKDYDPSTALEPFFGYPTSWMIWPYVPSGVGSINDSLGVISGINTGNTLQTASTRIWQRLKDGSSVPSYTLTADKTIANEGDLITFTLTTTGLDAGTLVDWTISGTGIQNDDIVPSNFNGQFILDDTGRATHSLKIVEDNTTEGNEILKFALTYIKNKQVTVLITDTSKYPEGNSVSYEGTHEISILPNQTIKFHLHGAMGGGGGSVYSGGGSPNAQNGGEVSCQIGASILTASGGKAGTGGVWGNGSSYHNGEPGKGGIPIVNDPDSIFELIEETSGIDAKTYSRWETQKGAEALSSIIGQMNAGGNGAIGIGDERWSYGGAGGSGARIRAIFTNNTDETIVATINVGKFGEGWKNYGISGTDGGIGFAIIESYNS